MTSDYAACIGDRINQHYSDKANGAVITSKVYKDGPEGDPVRLVAQSFFSWQSDISFRRITDGLSNTFFVGEKHIPEAKFTKPSVDSSIHNGDYLECVTRVAAPSYPPVTDIRLGWEEDNYNDENWLLRFGSYHPGVLQFALCDGSVQTVQTEIDTEIYGYLANREDGQVTSTEAF